MNNQNQKVVIQALWVFCLLVSLVVLVLALPGYLRASQNYFLGTPSTVQTFDMLQSLARWTSTVFSIFTALVSIALAILVFRRKPEDRMAVFFSFYLLFYAAFMSGPVEALNAYWLPAQPYLALKLQSVFFTLPNLVLLLVFPNGRFQPGWTRVIFWLGVLFTGGALFIDDSELIRPSSLIGFLLPFFLYGLLLAALATQIYRYFSLYTPLERQQVKWVFFGILAWIIGIALSSIPYYYLLGLPPGTPIPWWQPLGSAFWFLSLATLPVSFTVAILRSRLWDIDLIVRRTLLYALVTVLLALVYFGGVTLIQTVFTATSGQSSPFALVLSTLAIAALFNPLRNRLQDLIDHRFYRRKYDAEKALANFAAVARSETDLEQLSQHLASTVQVTLQPEEVELWLCITERAS